jgi:DNA invertase Pin-like site-specific DNA recombinase
MTHPKTAQAALLPSKILNRHLDRQAIVYVRQSTLQQLEHNKESTAVQYALVERACLLGWARPRVTVIDDDLGVSGASVAGRPGFQRLVAEVGLGHVGLVLGFEVSRLARSCRDWYQLLEICALSGTLIGDNDGIYDPTGYNDRLLLGLKGTMSEAELHIMRARFEEGRWHKAGRGEFGFNMPRGFLRRPSGEIVLDPNERVRETVQLVFDIFERRRSVHGVVRYLYSHGISLPGSGALWSRQGRAHMGSSHAQRRAQPADQPGLCRSLRVRSAVTANDRTTPIAQPGGRPECLAGPDQGALAGLHLLGDL